MTPFGGDKQPSRRRRFGTTDLAVQSCRKEGDCCALPGVVILSEDNEEEVRSPAIEQWVAALACVAEEESSGRRRAVAVLRQRALAVRMWL